MPGDHAVQTGEAQQMAHCSSPKHQETLHNQIHPTPKMDRLERSLPHPNQHKPLSFLMEGRESRRGCRASETSTSLQSCLGDILIISLLKSTPPPLLPFNALLHAEMALQLCKLSGTELPNVLEVTAWGGGEKEGRREKNARIIENKWGII